MDHMSDPQTPENRYLPQTTAGKGALIGVIAWTVFAVVITILSFLIPILVFSRAYFG